MAIVDRLSDRWRGAFGEFSLPRRMGWLHEALEALGDLGPRGGLERFAASLEPEWIGEALSATGTVSVRRRKFPAEQAVWLVLGMALYADRPIKAVVDHLGLVMTGDRHLAASAISKARYRLGPKPVRWLFERVSGRCPSRC